MTLLILAREDALLFDRTYAQNMNLPFDEGWEHWEVYASDPRSRNLTFKGEFDRYVEAEAYVTAASNL